MGGGRGADVQVFHDAALARRTLVLLLALGTMLAAGCGGDDPDPVEPDSGVEQFTDLSVPIEVEAGSELELVLDSNPSTGYAWKLRGKPDADVLTYEGTEYVADPGSEGLAGGGGVERLRFRAVGPGEATVALAYVFAGGGDGREPAERERGEIIVR